MLASSIPQVLPEETEGDGNCAFNAFILGLSRQSVIDRLDAGFLHSGEDPNISMRDFINKTAKMLNISSSWATVKATLAKLRIENKILLQKQLAPVLRQLAVNLEEGDYAFVERTMEPLLSAYSDFYKEHLGKEKKSCHVEDDIFKRHLFIQQKFKELVNAHQEPEAATAELKSWWKSQHTEQPGYRQFLQEMKKDGVWAGDLELFQLARYFHINLDVLREDFIHRIYMNSGKVPRHYFDPDQIKQLITRQIINPPQPGDEDLYFLPMTEADVQQRLKAIAEFDEVAWFVLENHCLKGMPVPVEWQSCLNQLSLRNIIHKENGQYKFVVNQDEALERIAEIAIYEKVLQTWRAFHYEAPTVMLLNPSATHWSNALPKNDLSLYQGEPYFKYVCAALVYSLMMPKTPFTQVSRHSSYRLGFFAPKQLLGPVSIVAASRPKDRNSLLS